MFSRKKKRLVFVNRIDKKNQGDLVCSLYSNLPQTLLDSLSEKFELVHVDIKKKHKIKKDDKIIVGGGGLINLPFAPFWDQVIDNKNDYIVIGAGENFGASKSTGHYVSPSQEEVDLLTRVIRNAKYCALRDINPDVEYSPCPSMQYLNFSTDIFCRKEELGKKLLLCHHQVITPETLSDSDLNILDNSNIHWSDMIAGIADSEYVFTSSYHAFIWSVLLGKKVYVLPFTTKFIKSKYAEYAKMCTFEEFKSKLLCPDDSDFPKSSINDGISIFNERNILESKVRAGLKILLK